MTRSISFSRPTIGSSCELVGAELVERWGARLSPARRRRLWLLLRLSQDASRLAAHSFEVHAKALEHTSGDAFTLADKAEQHVLCADVGMVEAARFVDGEFDHLLRARGETNLATTLLVTAADDEFDGRANFVQLHAEVRQHLRCHAVALADESEQQVLGTDVIVVEALGFLLSERQNTPGSFGELIEAIGHFESPSASVIKATTAFF